MRRILLLGLLLGVGTTSTLAAEEEPVLLGKKASEWGALLLGEKDRKNREAALFVIGSVGSLPGMFKEQAEMRKRGLIGLRLIGPDKYPPAVALIVTALQNDPEPEIRRASAQALGGMYEKIERGRFAPAREALTVALRRDSSARVREAAATALGLIDPEEARSAVLVLKQSLEDTAIEVVQAAADTLRRLGKEAAEAAPDLVNLLKNAKASPLSRTQAALALARIGAPVAVQAGAVGALKDVILSAETPLELRAACITSVGFFGKDAATAAPAIGALLGSKGTPLELRRKAVDTLDLLGLEARSTLPELLKALKDDDKHVRARAIHALSILGKDLGSESPAVVKGFHEALSDSTADVRIAAINGCLILGPETLGDRLRPIVERLAALSRDTQKDVAEAAKNALTQLIPR